MTMTMMMTMRGNRTIQASTVTSTVTRTTKAVTASGLVGTGPGDLDGGTMSRHRRCMASWKRVARKTRSILSKGKRTAGGLSSSCSCIASDPFSRTCGLPLACIEELMSTHWRSGGTALSFHRIAMRGRHLTPSRSVRE